MNNFATSSFVCSYDANGNWMGRSMENAAEESKSRKPTGLDGVKLDSLAFNVILSPNPAKDYIRIQINPLRSECRMDIYTLSGVKVLSRKIVNSNSFIYIGKYPTGEHLL